MITHPQQMRPGMEPLLGTLGGSAVSSKPGVDWGVVLDLAEEQHVLPIVARSLRDAGETLLPEVEERVATIERECARAAFWWTSELKGVLQQFNAEAIETILLKGPFFAQRIYGGAHLRTSGDIDLLVRRAQLQPARTLLVRLGFTLTEQDNGHHEAWERGTTALELHYDVAPQSLFDFGIETAWSAALPATFAGQPTLCLQGPDELLFLCLHGMRHCFDRLGYVLDIALFLDHLAGVNPDGPLQMLERPDTKPLSGVLVFGCALAQRLRPGNAWRMESPVAPRERTRLQARAEAHWHTTLTRTPPPRSWASMRRFYRRTQGSWFGYARTALRDVRDGAALLIEADYEFAERFGIARDRRWLIHIARYVRLALK